MNKNLFVFAFFVLISLSFSYCDGNYLSGNWLVSNSTSCSDEVIYVTGNINIFSNGTPPSTDEYFNNNEFNLSKYSGYIETEQVPNGLGNNPAYSGDWENNASFVYKTFMNNSQHAIQIFHNQTQNIGTEEAVYTMNIDNNQNSGYYGLDFFFGNSTTYGLNGVFVYNSSYPPIGFQPIPSGTVYTSGSEWGNTNLSNNCSIYYYSKDNLIELAINCTGGFTSKTVTGLNDKYTIFTNGSTLFQQGNLTLDNVTLIFNQTYSGQYKFCFGSDYAIFHGENITMTTNDTSYKYNITLEHYDGNTMSNHNFYLNNSNIEYVNATGFQMTRINGNLNITNNVFHNFTNTFPVFSMSEINNSIISGNTIHYNDSGMATPFYMANDNYYNRIENNYIVGEANPYMGFSFINSDNDYNNFTNNSGNLSFSFTGEDQHNEGNILRNNQIYSMAFDNTNVLNTLIYNTSYGSINWTLGNLSLSIPLSSANFTFSTANITFDSTNYPNLNDSASLIFNEIHALNTPQLNKNGVRCDDGDNCNITFDNSENKLYVNVSSFSSYEIAGGLFIRAVNGSYSAFGNATYFYNTIQEALDASSDGEKILIFSNSSGSNGYEENVNISTKVNLTGYTSDVLIGAKDSEKVTLNVSVQCNISNLKVNGTTGSGLSSIRLNGDSEYSILKDLVVSDGVSGIAVLVEYAKIIGCTIDNNTNAGITVNSAWYSVIENSSLSGNDDYAIYFDGGYYNNVTNVSITNSETGLQNANNNYFNVFDNLSVINISSGFCFENGGGHNITNSNIENIVVGGILVVSSNIGIKVENSTIINATLGGINFTYSNGSQAINNTIINSSGHGIYSSDSNDITLQSNTIYNHSLDGIVIYLQGDKNITNITISGNTIYDTENGIEFSVVTSTYDIKEIEVIGNSIYNTGYGIYSDVARTLEVTYNNISNTTNNSIYIYDYEGGNCLIAYNIIVNSTNYDADEEEGGVAIYIGDNSATNETIIHNNISLVYTGIDFSSNNSNIHNNTFTNVYQYGINLDTVSGANVSDNTFTNVSYDAIIISDASDILIQNNNIFNVTGSTSFDDEGTVFEIRGAFNLLTCSNVQIINNTINKSLDGVYSLYSYSVNISGNTFNTTNYSIFIANGTINQTGINYINTLQTTGYDLYLENATFQSNFSNITTPYLTYALNTSNNISIKSTNLTYYNLTTVSNLYDSNNDSITFTNSKLVKTNSETYGLNITNVSAGGSTSIKLFYNTSDLGDYSTSYLGVGKTSLGDNWTYYSQDTTPTTSISLNNITSFSYFAPLVYSVSSSSSSPSSGSTPSKKNINLEYRFNCETGLLEITAVEGAQVLIIGSYQPSKIADENGYTNFTLFSGTYTIKATLDGYHPAYLTNIELTTCTTSEQEEEPEQPETNQTEVLTCGNYSLGETWDYYDGCNTCSCVCTLVGEVPTEDCACTERYCPPTIQEDANYSIDYAQHQIDELLENINSLEGEEKEQAMEIFYPFIQDAQEKLNTAIELYNQEEYESAQEQAEQALSIIEDAKAPANNIQEDNQEQEQPKEQDLTLLYILGGIIVIVILGAGAMVLFKMKK